MKATTGERLLEKIGKLYLHWSLRQPDKVQRELRVKYEGHYRNAGLVLLFDLLMGLAVVAAVILVAGIVYFLTA